MKRMKQWSACLLAVLLLLGTLAACGGSAASNSAASDTGSAPGKNWGAMEETSNGYYDGADMDISMDSSTSDSAGGSFAPQAPAEPESPNAGGKKLIYTARLEVETTEFENAHQSLTQITESLGGYFENRNTNNYGSYRYGNYTIRIPVEYYKDFLAQVSQFCLVRNTDESIQDVSEAYYDIEARLTTQRTKLERLQELLAKADNMADIITIESAISDTELEIEYLTGSLRGYDNRIQYATVHVSLNEVYKLSNMEEPPVTFGQRMASAFAGGCRNFVDFLEDSAIFIARSWIPLLVLAAAAVTVVVVIRRVRRKSRSVPPQKPET